MRSADNQVHASLTQELNRLREEVNDLCEDKESLEDVLQSLSSYLGAGWPENSSPEEYNKRIRWGINYNTNSTIRLCASVVERLSQRPNTTWGEVKTEILKLIQEEGSDLASLSQATEGREP